MSSTANTFQKLESEYFFSLSNGSKEPWEVVDEMIKISCREGGV